MRAGPSRLKIRSGSVALLQSWKNLAVRRRGYTTGASSVPSPSRITCYSESKFQKRGPGLGGADPAAGWPI
ncbi:hypothetical protein RJ55_05650 [Drechmeria coniospora]|nr:hypothetical protein RJ55_05650 [Drechmeria coniospora]